MARKPRRLLPFRIPFFRIFYSTTYTILFFFCLCVLAITPTSLIYSAVKAQANQYTIMIGGMYVLTGLLAIFIYSSRLYTNRTVLAGVGKAYIPIEDGEVGKSVRRMIVRQLERSAIIAWESRPRDLEGEILRAEQRGVLPPETASVGRNDYEVGRIIVVDPARPPWGNVRHAGWSSPSHRRENANPDVQFADVLAELPNLLEARAVSLAPPPTPDEILLKTVGGHTMADPIVVELLRRPETMGLRDYLTQLSYLCLVNPPELGQTLLLLYEKARFSGRPATEREFEKIMALFSELLAGMTELDAAIVEQIHLQARDHASIADDASVLASETASGGGHREVSTLRDPPSRSPVTARTAPSRTVTPYLQQEPLSVESFSSVIHNVQANEAVNAGRRPGRRGTSSSTSITSLPSDAGSVVIHATSANG